MTVPRPDNDELKDFEKFMDTEGERYLGPTVHNNLEDIYLALDEAISDLKEEHKDKVSDMEEAANKRIEELEQLLDSLKEDLSDALEENIQLGGLDNG